MKLNELVEEVNEKMKEVVGLKYEDGAELYKIVHSKLSEIDTGMGSLIRFNFNDIRLITEDEINTAGTVGNLLLDSKIELKRDGRVKYGSKGKVISIEFYVMDRTKHLLNTELSELQEIFDNADLLRSIRWHDSEAKRYSEKVKDHKKRREELIQKAKEKGIYDK